jgi:MFS family permease
VFQIGIIAYAPLLGEIAKDLAVDMGAATNLMAAFMLSATLALFLGGAVCDRYGVRTVIVMGLLFSSAPATMMPLIGTNYWVVFGARLVQGFSVGFILAAWAPLMAMWFPPENRGLIGGLIGGSIPLGSAIGVLASPALFLAVGNWQRTVALLSIPGWLTVALALAIWDKLRDSRVQARPGDEPTITGGSVFREALFAPITWIGILVAFFSAWCLQSVYNLIPAYLAIDKPVGVGFGPMLSGQLSLAIMISGMFSPVLGGMLQDKVFRGNARPVVVIGFLLTGAFTYAILLPFVYTNMTVLSICLIAVGSGVMMMNPAMAVFVSSAYPTGIVGKMNGMWLGVGAFGGVAGLYAGGRAVAWLGNFKVALLMIVLAAAVGIVFALFLVKPKRLSPLT